MQEKNLILKFNIESLKFLKKCDNFLYERILKKIKELLVNPFPNNSKKLKGTTDNAHRIRVGDYRILYNMDFELNEIRIIKIDKRSTVYRIKDEED